MGENADGFFQLEALFGLMGLIFEEVSFFTVFHDDDGEVVGFVKIYVHLRKQCCLITLGWSNFYIILTSCIKYFSKYGFFLRVSLFITLAAKSYMDSG